MFVQGRAPDLAANGGIVTHAHMQEIEEDLRKEDEARVPVYTNLLYDC